MKILFVTYQYWPPYFGGELKSSIERFQSLSKRDHSVIALTSGVPEFPKKEQNVGISIRRSPYIHDSHWGRGIRRLLFPFWVIFQGRKINFEVLHFGSIGGVDPISHCVGMLLIILLAKIKKAKTVYVHSLADTEEEMYSNRGFKRRMRNIWLKKIDAVVSVSPALHNAVSKFHHERSHLILYGVRDDIFTIPNPIDRVSFRNEYYLEKENCVFSFLGTIGKRKGFDLIADAFLELSEHYPHWRLWVIGPKSENESQNITQHMVDDLIEPLFELGERVKFWGKIDNRKYLANILGASDIFLFPSRKEGFGIAPLEAMACGTPPIISRIPGVTDQANIEGKTGFYCGVGDINSLKDKMVILGTDQQLRKKMGLAARESILADFSWDKYISSWEDLYKQLTAIDQIHDIS